MNRRNGNRLQMLLRFGMKPAILALSMVVMITSVASGSLAWLTDKTSTIRNVFTYGDIWIDLTESDVDNDNDPNNNKYPMQPGATIEKDPKVTVFANSEDSWVFIELVESKNFRDFLKYDIADGWQFLLSDGHGRYVYYRNVDSTSTNLQFDVLAGNKVSVLDTVTKEQLMTLTAATYPTLEITAYAVQKDLTVNEINTAQAAWIIINEDDAALLNVNNTQELIESAQDDDDNADSFILDDAQQPTNPEQPGADEPQQPAGEQIQTEGEPQQPGSDEGPGAE